MTRSMTGFGRATGAIEGETYTLEVSSVNHRFFDCTVRLPAPWIVLEGFLRERMKDRISRGKIYLVVRRDRGPGVASTVKFDHEVAKRYIESARELAHLMSSTDALSLDTLAQLEGVFYQEEKEQDLEEIKVALGTTLDEAVAHLNKNRAIEGESLAADTRARIAEMADALAQIESRLPELNAAYAERLRERMAEIAVDTAMTEERIALEVAVMAEKTDVNEEVVRLKSHFERVEHLLASDNPIGRELNFLAQEFQREINTLGSKIREVEVTREVVRMKSELEKLREQAQNIE